MYTSETCSRSRGWQRRGRWMIAAWLLLLAATGCDKPAAPTPETPPVVVTEPQTFYVDAAAASGGDGSLERPFLTLAEALTVADEGDTIQLAPGRYAECPVIESGVELRQIDASRQGVSIETSAGLRRADWLPGPWSRGS